MDGTEHDTVNVMAVDESKVEDGLSLLLALYKIAFPPKLVAPLVPTVVIHPAL